MSKISENKAEPVAWMCAYQPWDLYKNKPNLEALPLYTTPPQRKPLTDEEIEAIDQSMCGDREFYKAFARAIEAAHGIKDNP